jgi:ABC-type Zn2+ transport system substrate-binding protein/surface adhesin
MGRQLVLMAIPGIWPRGQGRRKAKKEANLDTQLEIALDGLVAGASVVVEKRRVRRVKIEEEVVEFNEGADEEEDKEEDEEEEEDGEADSEDGDDNESEDNPEDPDAKFKIKIRGKDKANVRAILKALRDARIACELSRNVVRVADARNTAIDGLAITLERLARALDVLSNRVGRIEGYLNLA